jgi:hypothetical protein
MFNSEACRKKYSRRASGFVRESSAFVRQSSGNRPAFTNKREFRVTFTVVFVSGHNPGEWDLGLLDVSTKAEMARIIQDYLEYVHQGWQITVKVESKPQFKPFE